jgi:autotransporter translocation and assembly factor TamB
LLSLTPPTGAYQVRARLSDTSLAALAGLALGMGWSPADLPLPAGVRGRLAADLDLSGRGTDVAALRGQAVLSVEGLALGGETPTGHLEARIAATASRVDVQTFALQTAGGEIQGHGVLDSSTGKLELPLRATLGDVGVFAKGFGVRVLGGHAELLGHVTGTREEPRLEGQLTWRGARIAGQGIDLIQGDIQVARGGLRTTGLELRSGKSRATVRGSLQTLGAAPIGRPNLGRELNLDVQGELDSARTDLIGLVPEDVDIQGTFRASGRMTGTPDRLTGDITLGLEDVRTWQESWTRGGAVVRFRQGDVDITGIDFRRGTERITGQVRLPADGSLQGQLESTSMDLAHVAILARRGLTGHASFRLDLQGTRQAGRFLIQANGSEVFWRGIPMGAATGSLRVERKTLDMYITFLEGTHRLQAHIGPPPASLFTGELTLSDADLGAVLQAAKVEALRPWRPRGDGRIVIRGEPEDSGSTRGEAELESLRLVMNGCSFESQGLVRATWDGPDFKVESLRLRSGGHEVQVSGGGTGNRIDLQLTGQVPLAAVADRLKGWTAQAGVAAGTLRLRGSQASPEAWGRVEIGQGHLELEGFPLEFQDVHASLDLQGDRIEVPQYQAMVAGGALRGNADLRQSEDRSYLTVAFQQEDGRVAELLSALAGEQREITGRVSLAGAVSSERDATTGPAGNMTGSLSLRMRDGLIGRYTVAAKILALLNLADMVEAQGPDLKSRGMPYQQITADFKIEGGRARTENLVIKSPAVRMTAVGSVGLTGKTVEMTVGVQPFQNLDRIVSRIPVAGWLLAGKEQSVVVAYFQVSGPLSDPQVSTLPVKSVGRNVFGILRNLLELPGSFSGPYQDLPPPKLKQDEEPKR